MFRASSAMGVMPVPLGFSRTYARVEGAFTPENFWAAVKAGRYRADLEALATRMLWDPNAAAGLLSDDRGPEGDSVLIVDDKEMMRDSVGGTLRRAGFEVMVADSGHSALEQIRRKRPDGSYNWIAAQMRETGRRDPFGHRG